MRINILLLGVICTIFSSLVMSKSAESEKINEIIDIHIDIKTIEKARSEKEKIMLLKDLQVLFEIGDLERIQDVIAMEMAGSAAKLNEYRNSIRVADGRNEISSFLNGYKKYVADSERFSKIYNTYPRFETFLNDLPYEFELEDRGKNSNELLFLKLSELVEK